MNISKNKINYEDISIILAKVIKGEAESAEILDLSYINNPDGTVRWLYPKKASRPTFLGFYNVSSVRSRLLASVIKVLFYFRLSNLVESGDISVSIEGGSLLHDICETYGRQFSVFTGTVGENRKIIIEVNKNGNIDRYYKVPLNRSSASLVLNEKKVLEKLSQIKLKSLVVPEVTVEKAGGISVSNIKPISYVQLSSIDNVHISVVLEYSETCSEVLNWGGVIKEQRLLLKCNELKSVKQTDNGLDLILVNTLASNISKMLDLVADESIVKCGLVHGDFTPWNMYKSERTLYIYDWELSRERVPCLYDIYHFIFQSNILITKSDYASIKKEVVRLIKAEGLIEITGCSMDEINHQFIFYIADVCTYYLDIYMKQDTLHLQVDWLLSVWNDATNDILVQCGRVFEK